MAGRAGRVRPVLPSSRGIAPLPRIYVTGHRNPDTDSIAAAIGYAELMGRLDPRNDYVPVRLGDLNAQTRWVLERGRRAASRSFLAPRDAARARRDARASSRWPPTTSRCARSA